jgi:2-iminobutanoate/2-iminopropanoate deaminase
MTRDFKCEFVDGEAALAEKKVIFTEQAPKPIGPYSQAVEVGEWIFCSGQIPLDPKTGLLVEGDMAVKAARVLDNLEAVLKTAGSSLEDAVKLTVYLTDLGEFDGLNRVLAERFSKAPPPARSVIQVSKLPKGASVEMDLIARKKSRSKDAE